MVRFERPRRGPRPAFTLVEMMVSTALILFMMYILASAFEKGIESFRILKKAGDMQERLRAATTIMRLDLTRDHFGKHILVSDQRLDQPTWRMPADPNRNDGGGYFRIYQHDGTSAIEGVDPDDTNAVYTRSTNNILQFTMRLQPDDYRRDLFFSTNTQVVWPPTPNNAETPQRLCEYSVPDYMRPSYANGEQPTSVYAGRWAEVTYYLRELGATAGNTPLYGLYRRQKLLVEKRNFPALGLNQQLPNPGRIDPNDLLDMALWADKSGTAKYNAPSDATVPGRRFGTSPVPNWTKINDPWVVGGHPLYADNSPFYPNARLNTLADEVPSSGSVGGDLLLSDVVCFEVKVLWDIPTDGTTFALQQLAPAPGTNLGVKPPVYPPQDKQPQLGNIGANNNPPNNPDFPFDLLPVGSNPYYNSPPAPPYPNRSVPKHLRVFDTWSQETSLPDGYDFMTETARSFSTGQPDDPTWNVGYCKTRIDNGQVENRPPNNVTIPLRVRVRAIQIKLRIWDVKSQTSRQVTIIQDL